MTTAPTDTGNDSKDDDWRLDRLRDSYREVLEATKHEDDKVARFLATIAFLVAGALAFLPREVVAATYKLDGASVPLPAVFLGLFLTLTVLAVMMFVMSIGTPLTFFTPPQSRRTTSHLYFHLIQRVGFTEWESMWDDVNSVRAALREEYQREIYNLAARTANKRARAQEATALFLVALAAFGLLVGVGVDVLHDIENPQWDLGVRLPVFLGLSAYGALLLYWKLRELRINQPEGPLGIDVATVAVGQILFIGSLLIPNMFDTPWPVVLNLCGIAFAVAGSVGLLHDRGTSTAIVTLNVTLALFGIGALFAMQSGAGARLALAGGAAISPLLPNLFQSFRETTKLRKARTT